MSSYTCPGIEWSIFVMPEGGGRRRRQRVVLEMVRCGLPWCC